MTPVRADRGGCEAEDLPDPRVREPEKVQDYHLDLTHRQHTDQLTDRVACLTDGALPHAAQRLPAGLARRQVELTVDPVQVYVP